MVEPCTRHNIIHVPSVCVYVLTQSINGCSMRTLYWLVWLVSKVAINIVNVATECPSAIHQCCPCSGASWPHAISTYSFDFPSFPPNTHIHPSTISPLPTLSHSVTVRRLLPSANRLLPLRWMVSSLRSEQLSQTRPPT